jgi:hypothetical protein
MGIIYHSVGQYYTNFSEDEYIGIVGQGDIDKRIPYGTHRDGSSSIFKYISVNYSDVCSNDLDNGSHSITVPGIPQYLVDCGACSLDGKLSKKLANPDLPGVFFPQYLTNGCPIVPYNPSAIKNTFEPQMPISGEIGNGLTWEYLSDPVLFNDLGGGTQIVRMVWDQYTGYSNDKGVPTTNIVDTYDAHYSCVNSRNNKLFKINHNHPKPSVSTENAYSNYKDACITKDSEGENVDIVIVSDYLDGDHPEFAVNKDGSGGSRFINYNWHNHDTDVLGFETKKIYNYNINKYFYSNESEPYQFADEIIIKDYIYDFKNNTTTMKICPMQPLNTPSWTQRSNPSDLSSSSVRYPSKLECNNTLTNLPKTFYSFDTTIINGGKCSLDPREIGEFQLEPIGKRAGLTCVDITDDPKTLIEGNCFAFSGWVDVDYISKKDGKRKLTTKARYRFNPAQLPEGTHLVSINSFKDLPTGLQKSAFNLSIIDPIDLNTIYFIAGPNNLPHEDKYYQWKGNLPGRVNPGSWTQVQLAAGTSTIIRVMRKEQSPSTKYAYIDNENIIDIFITYDNNIEIGEEFNIVLTDPLTGSIYSRPINFEGFQATAKVYYKPSPKARIGSYISGTGIPKNTKIIGSGNNSKGLSNDLINSQITVNGIIPKPPAFPVRLNVSTLDPINYPIIKNKKDIKYKQAGINYNGTAVASIAAGNTNGWASKSNIYFIRKPIWKRNIDIYNDLGIDRSLSDDPDVPTIGNLWAHYIEVFHKNKPINPKTGKKNPTIVHVDFNTQIDLSQMDNRPGTVPLVEITETFAPKPYISAINDIQYIYSRLSTNSNFEITLPTITDFNDPWVVQPKTYEVSGNFIWDTNGSFIDRRYKYRLITPPGNPDDDSLRSFFPRNIPFDASKTWLNYSPGQMKNGQINDELSKNGLYTFNIGNTVFDGPKISKTQLKEYIGKKQTIDIYSGITNITQRRYVNSGRSLSVTWDNTVNSQLNLYELVNITTTTGSFPGQIKIVVTDSPGSTNGKTHFEPGDRITFTGTTNRYNAGTPNVTWDFILPNGMSKDKIYYVLSNNYTRNSFQIAETPNGTPLTIQSGITSTTTTVSEGWGRAANPVVCWAVYHISKRTLSDSTGEAYEIIESPQPPEQINDIKLYPYYNFTTHNIGAAIRALQGVGIAVITNAGDNYHTISNGKDKDNFANISTVVRQFPSWREGYDPNRIFLSYDADSDTILTDNNPLGDNFDTNYNNFSFWIHKGDCKGGIIVGAVDEKNIKADFSCTGDLVDIYAPGVNIVAAFPNDPNNLCNFDFGVNQVVDSRKTVGRYKFVKVSGTSYSAAQVVGVLACSFGHHHNNNSLYGDPGSTKFVKVLNNLYTHGHQAALCLLKYEDIKHPIEVGLGDLAFDVTIKPSANNSDATIFYSKNHLFQIGDIVQLSFRCNKMLENHLNLNNSIFADKINAAECYENYGREGNRFIINGVTGDILDQAFCVIADGFTDTSFKLTKMPDFWNDSTPPPINGSPIVIPKYRSVPGGDQILNLSNIFNVMVYRLDKPNTELSRYPVKIIMDNPYCAVSIYRAADPFQDITLYHRSRETVSYPPFYGLGKYSQPDLLSERCFLSERFIDGVYSGGSDGEPRQGIQFVSISKDTGNKWVCDGDYILTYLANNNQTYYIINDDRSSYLQESNAKARSFWISATPNGKPVTLSEMVPNDGYSNKSPNCNMGHVLENDNFLEDGTSLYGRGRVQPLQGTFVSENEIHIDPLPEYPKEFLRVGMKITGFDLHTYLGSLSRIENYPLFLNNLYSDLQEDTTITDFDVDGYHIRLTLSKPLLNFEEVSNTINHQGFKFKIFNNIDNNPVLTYITLPEIDTNQPYSNVNSGGVCYVKDKITESTTWITRPLIPEKIGRLSFPYRHYGIIYHIPEFAEHNEEEQRHDDFYSLRGGPNRLIFNPHIKYVNILHPSVQVLE